MRSALACNPRQGVCQGWRVLHPQAAPTPCCVQGDGEEGQLRGPGAQGPCKRRLVLAPDAVQEGEADVGRMSEAWARRTRAATSEGEKGACAAAESAPNLHMPRTGRGEKRVGGEGVQGRLSHLHFAHAHITTHFTLKHFKYTSNTWQTHGSAG
jgi:hypothetical protein